jgi:hypothetical protein
MRPFIDGVRPEKRFERLDRLRRSWQVAYQFCGLSAQITVQAENEADALAKAADELRMRDLKVA